MRSIFIYFLSLLIFCVLVSAVSQAHPQTTEPCAPCDAECHLASVDKWQDEYTAVLKARDWIDVPWLDLEAGLVRLDPGLSMYQNVVRCWPSVGGIIIAERVHAVELAYIGLDRFRVNARSLNQTEEDGFCMKVRKIGGKWWSSYADFDGARYARVRRMWPDEREVLFLGWPEQGGVWLLRYHDPKMVKGNVGPIWNALNMEERCMALERRGAVFFENPVDNEIVGPLLTGFGEREQRNEPDIEDGGWWDHGCDP